MSELQGIENYALVNVFFLSYYGALWKCQLEGIEYEVAVRKKLWESALSEFKSSQVEQSLNAIKTGDTDFAGIIPLPGDFAKLCRRFKPIYYGPKFIDTEKVKQLPTPPVNKEKASSSLAEMKQKLGMRPRA